ncbi:hypothetical protein S245_008819, partial [Arachis hypogaea]
HAFGGPNAQATNNITPPANPAFKAPRPKQQIVRLQNPTTIPRPLAPIGFAPIPVIVPLAPRPNQPTPGPIPTPVIVETIAATSGTTTRLMQFIPTLGLTNAKKK